MTANPSAASSTGPARKPAAKPAVADIYPLTPLQKGLLFHALYEPDSAVYFEQLCVTLEGDLDAGAFERAWRRLIDRHAILRSAFVTKGQREPVQVVFDQVPFAISQEDWSGLDEASRRARLDAFLEEDRRRGFAFNRPPLMRIALVRLGPGLFRMVWSHHHLLLDGWSLPILMGELFALYRSERDGTLAALPTPAAYGDYVAWLGRQDRAAAEAFWRDHLAGLEGPTPLGIDIAGKRGGAGGIEQRVFALDAAATAAVAELARRCRVTQASVVESAWAIVLSRYAGTDDVTFGVTLSSRPADLPGSERMVGLFVNSLPLRIAIDAAKPVADLLRQVQERQLQLQRFDHCGLTDIQGWSPVPRGEPLFESLFAFENFPLGDRLGEAVPEIAVRDATLIEKTHYPLTLIVVPGATLTVKVAVDTARIPAEAAEGVFRHLAQVLDAMAADAARLVASIGLLPDPLVPAGIEDVALPANSLAEAFAATAARFPDRTAVVDGKARLTYAELAARAAPLARRLRAAGAGPDRPVGICLEKSADLIVAMLAVVEAGGAYLPLDPAYPEERLAFLVADSGAAIVVTTAELAGRLPQSPALVLIDRPSDVPDAAATRPAGPDDAAYVIYTSGSTGTPKGVVVTHRNVLRLFAATQPWFGFGERDVWCMFHSFAFDFSVWETWGALLHGGTLVMVPWLVSRDPDAFLTLLERERVTVLNQTPSAFAQLMAADAARPSKPGLALRTVVFGGEALEPAMLAPWVARRGDRMPELVNMYGITETTVHVTYRPIRSADIEAGGHSVIGRPIPDLGIEILDQHGHPVPPGAIGEICVLGAGVARGYLGRPELTAERFVERASPAGTVRLYRSGDLARRLPDGDIEYCGRRDHQVKVRGFRIETGEIESALSRHPQVAQALVLAPQGAAGRRLVAYLAMRPGEARPGADALRGFLRGHLPDHMVPEAFVPLDAFPLTVNGKIDRAALPDPDAARTGVAGAYAPPETETQRILCEAWAAALGVERVGIDDDYFALGGDSIRSIRLVALARDKGVTASLPQLFGNPTVRRLAAVLDAAGPAAGTADKEPAGPFSLVAEADRALLPAWAEDAYPLTRLQAGMLFHGDFDAAQSLYQDLFLFRLRLPVDIPALERALAETVAAHPALRTGFDLESFSRPLQLVRREVPSPLSVSDLRGLPAAEQESRLAAHVAEERRLGYDWRQAPCGRIAVHRLADDVVHLSLGFHHAVLDGWSVATFLAEWVQRYLHRLGRGVGAVPAAPAGSFRDFVALETRALADPAIRGYWERTLAGLPITALPRRRLPADAPRPSGRLDRAFPPELTERLREVARTSRLPLKALLLAAHLRVLALLAGSSDVVTGLVSNGRPDDRDSTRVLGLFLNTLPFRLRIERRWSWLDLARAAHAGEAAMLPHRRLPMAELRRIAGGRALFETSFNFVNFHVYQGLAGLRDIELLDTRSFDDIDIPFSVSFSDDAGGGPLRVGIGYDAAQFSDGFAETAADLLEGALRAFAEAPDQPFADAALVEPLPPSPDFPAEAPAVPVHRAVLEQARLSPDRTAVVAGGDRWTYGELAASSARLAHRLRALGVGPDRPVALLLERSFAFVSAMLGTLLAGGAYVPLDPAQPPARLASALETCRPAVLVTAGGTAGVAVPDGTITLDLAAEALELSDLPATAPEVADHPDALAYLIFTSGSTGKPKGVAVPNRALADHMAWFLRDYPVRPDDVMLQKTPVVFDASVDELWAALMSGATLRLARADGHRDPAYLAAEIAAGGVTLLHLVPTQLDLLLREPALADCRTLRRVAVGGEALPMTLVERLQALLPVEVINLYGPTETTVECSIRRVEGFEAGDTATLGDPRDGTLLHILDGDLMPVPDGVPGELYVGGAGLARGYWGAPDLTAERFVPDPFSGTPGARLYRTGDRVRRVPGGGLDYLGRVDRQTKLRGYRIEPDEVERVLERHPLVRRAAVSVRSGPGGSPRLVAYVEASDSGWEQPLADHARANLPDYMVPALYHPVHAWPLLASGKIDRSALPDPAEAPRDSDAGRPFRAPASGAETALAEVWRAVLAVERVGAEDDFFALGGDSILSLQIVARAKARGLVLTLQQVFRHPKLADMARTAVPLAPAAEEEPAEPLAGPVPLTPAQRWFFADPPPNPSHWNHAVLVSLRQAATPGQVASAVRAALGRHDAFRLRFRRTEAGWEQAYADRDDPVPFETVEVDGAAALTAHAAAVQRALDLTGGPLARAVLYILPTPERPRLLIAAHHLVVDGVSWRVLLHDFAFALTGLVTEPPPPRPAFGRWARGLAAAVASPRISGQAPFWLEEATAPAADLPADPSGPAVEGDARTVETVIDAETTALLLRAAPARLRADGQEILLAALAEALAVDIAPGDLRIALEAHGRQDLVPGVDLAGTVGWFTALHPFRLPVDGAGGPAAALARVKERLRRVPDDGIGHGLLRWYGDEAVAARLAAAPEPSFAFNYLGQVDGTFGDSGPIGMAPEAVGDTIDPSAPRRHALELVAAVVGGRLTLRWIHVPALHAADRVEAWADRFAQALERLVALDGAAARAAWTPSDFPLAGLDAGTLPLVLGDGEIDDIYPLTPAQEGMLFHTVEQAAGSGVYVQQVTARLDTPLGAEGLTRAWQAVLEAYPNLRAGFAWAGLPRPLQRIPRRAELPVAVLDWRALGEAGQAAALDRFLAEDRARGFDPATPPLMRVTLARTGETAWQVVWSHHHLLLDGWSMPIVFRGVMRALAAITRGDAPDLPGDHGFRDHVARLAKADPAGAADFWRERLADAPEAIFPAAGRRRGAGTGMAMRSLDLPPAPAGRLAESARRHGVTQSTLVNAAWAVLLGRYGGTLDVLYGVTVSGRPLDLDGSEGMVGMFINTLPVRAALDPAATLADWLPAFQAGFADLAAHQDSRLVDIQSWSGRPRQQPLFEAILVYENYPVASEVRASAGLAVGAVTAREQNNFPLSLYVLPGDGLRLELMWDRARLDDGAAGALLAELAALLEALADPARERIADLLPDAPDPAAIGSAGPVGPPVHRRILNHAEAEPGRFAVIAEDATLTYGELAERARRVASGLAAAGIRPDDRVGIFLDRGADLLPALLGVHLAGAAYIPLDPAFPAERLAMMVEDGRPAAIVATRALRAEAPPGAAPVLTVEDLLAGPEAPVPADPREGDRLAYVIFTSGSTGRPKGVAVGRRALANVVDSFAERPGFGRDDRLAAVTTLSFDIAALELFLPLAAGATLVLCGAATAVDGAALVELIASRGATVLQATPATWRLLLAADWRPPQGFAGWVGGEAVPADLAAALLDRGVALWNVYGPTETTIWSAARRIDDAVQAGVVGAPVRNTWIGVVDAFGRPAPADAPGELAIGGDGLAEGYWERPDLTADRFAANRFPGLPGARCYLTGDKAVRRPDGDFDILGRLDTQAKIRGFRIELGEIESVLRTLPGIAEAVVVIGRDAQGEPRLVANLVPEDGAPDLAVADLRERSLARLPGYMVPTVWRILPELPLTPNRKIDRKALAQAPVEVTATRLAPRDPVEDAVARLWAEAFGGGEIGVEDDFFDLGGHSLVAMRIHAKLGRVFQTELRLREFLEAPTVAAQAALLRSREAAPGRALKVAQAYLRLLAMTPEQKEALRQARSAGNKSP
ncbi:amino acid adenylation domain-containing protein (plasmid) [Skermanella sp. TT6]|uniref:Amino acid adenylation domain-containing protein n=1 Tax=Skermanella cutis TaxID=2775420 RepID=A0ABX7BIN0_9PROT|nr:non-ribosomal peptide synthetase [Skermanella sp. TT6]QQP93606.1 amino acid adenylation domain-containing protein [Skermanella sp. TT6]